MMTVLTMDDEKAALNILNRAIQEAVPDAEIHTYSDAEGAVRDIRENALRPDVAFLDIRMPGMTGLEMAKFIKEESPRTNIIFVTAFSDYALEAMAMHTSGYLMKPATATKVLAEIQELRYPLQRVERHCLRVQCFGKFEVFANGAPLEMRYNKTKELLAYLVDRRGSACNTAELCMVLWPEEPDSPAVHKRLRKLVSDLTHTLESVGADDVFLKRRNSFAVSTDGMDCDYYAMLNQDIAAINTYAGEYMCQYSWAEMTLGSLETKE